MSPDWTGFYKCRVILFRLLPFADQCFSHSSTRRLLCPSAKLDSQKMRSAIGSIDGARRGCRTSHARFKSVNCKTEMQNSPLLKRLVLSLSSERDFSASDLIPPTESPVEAEVLLN